MSDIYVTGHKNPDMDSICSAICYGELKQTLDPDNNYIPVRCGHLNEQTKALLKRIDASPPLFMKDIFPRVIDVVVREPRKLYTHDSILDVVKLIKQLNVSVIPVITPEQEYAGLVSVNEITDFFMSENIGNRPIYTFRTNNFEDVIPGTYYMRGEQIEFTTALMTGAMPFEISIKRISQLLPDKPLLVIGQRRKIVEYAVRNQFPAIVLTGIDSVDDIEVDFTGYKGTVYISEKDTAETVRLIRLSTPVAGIMDKEYPKLQANDLFEDAKRLLVGSEYRGLPVFEDDTFLGVVTRRCFIEKPRKKVVLVDHNEASQSIWGVESGEIREIIDHHRLGAEKTTSPIYIFSKPVGSTCTIVYQHFRNWGVEIKGKTALLLMAGIISDTVLLKSPTTTRDDIDALKELSAVSGRDYQEYGEEIFSSTGTLNTDRAEPIITADFKTYKEYDVSVGIGQVEVITFQGLDEVRDHFLGEMEKTRKKMGLDWVMLLITNVIKEESMLFSTSYEPAEKMMVYKRIEKGHYYLPGVLSRKKQLLPDILRVLEDLRANKTS